jgi:hypothetical protein
MKYSGLVPLPLVPSWRAMVRAAGVRSGRVTKCSTPRASSGVAGTVGRLAAAAD